MSRSDTEDLMNVDERVNGRVIVQGTGAYIEESPEKATPS